MSKTKVDYRPEVYNTLRAIVSDYESARAYEKIIRGLTRLGLELVIDYDKKGQPEYASLRKHPTGEIVQGISVNGDNKQSGHFGGGRQ